MMMTLQRQFAMLLLAVVSALLLSSQSVECFATHPAVGRSSAIPLHVEGSKRSQQYYGKTTIFSTPESEDESTKAPPTAVVTPPATTSNNSAASEETSYPIDLPSPLLLATSMILAIVGTGSGFDLANATPRFGFGITFSLATVALTLSVGLFYASILKAKAETEADDKEYMRGK